MANGKNDHQRHHHYITTTGKAMTKLEPDVWVAYVHAYEYRFLGIWQTRSCQHKLQQQQQKQQQQRQQDQAAAVSSRMIACSVMKLYMPAGRRD